MEILGVGPMELILILIIALIILGPNDMVKAGRTIGRFMRRVVTSTWWATLVQISRGVRTLPNRLMREAGLEEEINDLRQTQDELRKQVNEVMKIKNPLLASAQEIDQDVRSIGGGLSAWTTTPPAAPNEPANPAPAIDPSGLSAWTTPPQPGEPASPSHERGPAEIYPSNPPSSES